MGTMYFAEINSFAIKTGKQKYMQQMNPENIQGLNPKDQSNLDLTDDGNIYEQQKCFADNESFSFLIIWSIFNYIVILLFGILLITWYDVN